MANERSPFTIKNWATGDRPREKLIAKGRLSLTDAELLAILIGSGSTKESAVDLCKRILSATQNNLNQLGKMSLKQLTSFNGIGEAKALTIIAAVVLGRRGRGVESNDKVKITARASVCEVVQALI